MTHFEYISVFLSIIFGFGLAHLLSGAISQVYKRQFDYVHAACALLAFLILVANWWGTFAWRDLPEWTFELYFLLIAQALTFYGLCIAVYPPAGDFQKHRSVFWGLLLLSIVLDAGAGLLAGTLFDPPIYALWLLHGGACALAALLIRNRVFQIVMATYLVLVVLFWTCVVRHLIS